VDPIIRTCSLIALTAAALAAMPASASRESRSALSHYAAGRVAESAGDTRSAMFSYAAAMVADPGNTRIALKAFREAVEGGDRKLALRAAAQLEAAKALPIDGMLLLVGERLRTGDVRGAKAMIDRIEADQAIDFLVPVLRGWASLAAGDADPVAALDASAGDAAGSRYRAEHRALLMFAKGRDADGAIAVKALASPLTDMTPLRLAAAARLSQTGDRDGAEAMLVGQNAEIAAARALLQKGASIPGAVRLPHQGVGMLYGAYAAEMIERRAISVGVLLARTARFLDPASGNLALIEGRALAASGANADALAAFDAIGPAYPEHAPARVARLVLLERLGKAEQALAEAQAEATGPGATAESKIRLGDMLARVGRHREAAQAYRAALAEPPDATPVWALWLLVGSSEDRAGNWPEARKALEEAARLAPDQATVLNHLGYSMLERREDVPRALQLVERAWAANPDDAAITDSLGWAHFLAGDTKKAVEMLELALSRQPDEPTIGEHMGDVYWAVGRRIEARHAWQAAAFGAEGPALARLKDKIDIGLNASNAAR
jgi:tetratricopeptide (TPR) repeat protein